MGRAFEYRKAAKLKRWGHMAKTFTRLGKQIAIAVKAGGPEPENNPTLRSVIATCKRENMPKDNIERAIKNALGKDQSDYKSMTYEGYGPHGIAVFVDTLTDNTTRTVADVRSVFNKFGGNLGTMGSLAFLFDHKCMFTFKIKEGMDMEELILDLIDYDVEDEYEQDDEEGTITIYGDPKSYAAIQKHLEECGFEDVGGDFTYIPNDLKDVTPEQRETLDKMIERLEEFDDVQTVYTNMKPEKKNKQAMEYVYKTQGTCSTNIELNVEDGVVKEVAFWGGCNGNLQGISRLVKGMKVEEVIKKLEGVRCGGRPTSCPDQLCRALHEMGY